MYKSDQKLLCNTTTNHLGDGAVLEWEYLSVQDGHNSWDSLAQRRHLNYDLILVYCIVWLMLTCQFSFKSQTLEVAVYDHVCCMLSPVRLSSVCNVRALYSTGWNFRKCFFAIWYLGHPLTVTKFYRDRSRGTPPSRGGRLNARRVAKYSDFYISKVISRKRCKIARKLVLITDRQSYELSIGTKYMTVSLSVSLLILLL